MAPETLSARSSSTASSAGSGDPGSSARSAQKGEFHVLDLVGGIASQLEEDEISQSAQGLPRGTEELEKAGVHVTSLGDAGEMLDEQAKAAYRQRLSELREELEEAKELGRVDRAEQGEEEIDALTRELSRAVGLGGRNRRAASASERARKSITKTIKAVVEG